MRLRFLVVSSLCIASRIASAADAQLLKLVMPDAKVVSGIDVDRVRTTPFGQFFLSQIPSGDAGLNELISLTGFDPRQDVHEVLMASPGDPEKKSGLVLVRGRFDSQRILSLLKADGKIPENYHGIGVFSGGKPAHGVAQAAAFLDDSTLVAGDVASVHGAIDRRSASASLDATLSDKISRTSAAQDAWVVSLAPLSSFAPVAPDRNVKGILQGDLIKAIQQSSGGIRFGSTIEISGELTARTNQDAASLADVVKFFTNMAVSNAPSELNGLLQSLSVSAEANAVKLFVSISENELESLIRFSGHVQKGPRI